MLTISSLSLEYVRVGVAAEESGTTVDPTTDAVSMAFMSEGSTPASGDFHTASWETDTSVSPTEYYARALVGTGGAVALTAGVYDVWLKITDNPETPVKKAPASIRVT